MLYKGLVGENTKHTSSHPEFSHAYSGMIQCKLNVIYISIPVSYYMYRYDYCPSNMCRN